jgi:hypothetical protein
MKGESWLNSFTAFASDEKENKMEKKFRASVPRRMYFSHETKGTSQCPKCGAALEQEHHTYLFGVVNDQGSIDELVVGNKYGHFCPNCPVVVLDFEGFLEVAKISLGRVPREISFSVIGMVDLEAVPENKRHLPFDDENNPLPLVPFLHAEGERLAARKKARLADKRKRQRQHRRKKG